MVFESERYAQQVVIVSVDLAFVTPLFCVEGTQAKVLSYLWLMDESLIGQN
jgi:hypothetical protein